MNYCTKCGKEIPDGDNKVCEDCQKKLLEEIANEEKTEEIEKKKDKEEKKEKTNSKNESKNEKKGNKKIFFIVGIIILLVIIACVAFFVYKNYKNTTGVGNTIGNIRNYGYAAIEGNWIYYLAPNEDSSQVGIFKIKTDGTEKTELLMNEGDAQTEIVSINAVGDYVYFISISSNEENTEDTIDNKIYRMKTDGSDLEVINDNELNNDCYEIYVINGYIYYIDVNANVSKMKLDGTEKNVVAENGTGYLGLTENYIIYNNLPEENSTEYVTYIMNIDGTDPKPVIEGKRLYSVNIVDNYIYYTDENKKIYRTEINSNKEELVFDTEAYNLNVDNGYAYYLNYVDAENQDYTVCIYKTNLNVPAEERKAEVVMTLDTYSTFLNIVGDWAVYMDSNDTEGFINLVKTDGSTNTVELYNLNYEQYYDSLETETSNEISNTVTTSDTQQNQVTNEVSNSTNSTTIDTNTTNITETNTVVSNNTTANVSQ